MNESEISNHASVLRRQAICRLNGVEFQKSSAPGPAPTTVPEFKNEFWTRPRSDYRTLVPTLGAMLVIFNGYSLYVSEMQRNYLSGITKDRCVAGVTIQSSGGKHPAPYFKDAGGKKVASCFDFQCTYKNWRDDLGKAANICLSSDVVVSVEIEGGLRISREGLIDALDQKIGVSKGLLGFGLFIFAICAYRKRDKWKDVWRTRFFGQ